LRELGFLRGAGAAGEIGRANALHRGARRDRAGAPRPSWRYALRRRDILDVDQTVSRQALERFADLEAATAGLADNIDFDQALARDQPAAANLPANPVGDFCCGRAFSFQQVSRHGAPPD
jgi:hypothetical protein